MKAFFLVALSFAVIFTTAQEDQNIIDKGKIKYQIADGKAKLYTNDYRGALKVFREVLQADETNNMAHYWIAETYYNLKRFDLAKKYIDKVDANRLKKKMLKEYAFTKGKVYHRNEELDVALENLEKYKSLAKKKEIKDSEIENFIAQCNAAKEAMKHKKDVTITNLGKTINTANPEYSPSITGDGKTMIFTSRRADTKGGGVDEDFDHKYYEDIYISTWDEEENNWSEAENIPGSINTEFHDACLNISPDGNYIYIYRNIMNVTKTGDIYVSKKSSSGRWGTPKPIGGDEKDINSTYFESSASLTADGSTLYFVSDRPGGNGLADIYFTKSVGKNKWGEAQNLGVNVNTQFDESFVYVHPDGNVLFFASDGHNSLGGYDIFMCVKGEDGKWGEAQNLGYPINTVKDEKTFSVTADGKTAYIGCYYEDSKGESDIFKIDISSLNILGK